MLTVLSSKIQVNCISCNAFVARKRDVEPSSQSRVRGLAGVPPGLQRFRTCACGQETLLLSRKVYHCHSLWLSANRVSDGMTSSAIAIRNFARRSLQQCRSSSLRSLCSPAGTSPPVNESDDIALTLPDPRDPFANPLAVLGDAEMSADQRYWRRRAASSPSPVYERIVDEEGRAHAVGKRKRSVAKVWLAEGDGGIQVNGKNFVDVFHRVDHRDQILRPLMVTGKIGKVVVNGTVTGGGNTGQAEALRHGIAKALQLFNPDHRPPLKKDGLLTRDSRVVESKKYGLKYDREISSIAKSAVTSAARANPWNSSFHHVFVPQESKKGSDVGQAIDVIKLSLLAMRNFNLHFGSLSTVSNPSSRTFHRLRSKHLFSNVKYPHRSVCRRRSEELIPAGKADIRCKISVPVEERQLVPA